MSSKRVALRTLYGVLVVVLLFVVAIAATGCGATPGIGEAETGTSGAGSAGAPVDPPTMELIEPLDGATVSAGDVPVNVNTTGLKFVMASNTNVLGEGHVHYTLDDRPFIMSITPDAVIENVEPGEHTLVAELVQNNTEPFDPPVIQTITFTAE